MSPRNPMRDENEDSAYERGYGGTPGQGEEGNHYDQDDGLHWAQREAYRQDFQSRGADPRTVSQRCQTSSTSFGASQWDAAVDRAVEEDAGAAYHEGRHRGRGPRNFQPSDDRILDRICERLTADPAIDPSEVEVTCESGQVTLSGTVESRPMKHRIEDVVADCFGVRDIKNRLKVQSYR